jgi:hypothetical protein
MIHVPVADEDVTDAQKLARGKRSEIAKIEEKGTPLEDEIDIEPGIAKGLVHELRIEVTRHEPLSSWNVRACKPERAQTERDNGAGGH